MRSVGKSRIYEDLALILMPFKLMINSNYGRILQACVREQTHDIRLYESYASINSKREHPPPPGKPPGNFFEVVKSPAPGQNFPAKARPPGQKTPTPGEYFRRSSQPFLLTGVEILGFYRNQTLKRNGRLSN